MTKMVDKSLIMGSLQYNVILSTAFLYLTATNKLSR